MLWWRLRASCLGGGRPVATCRSRPRPRELSISSSRLPRGDGPALGRSRVVVQEAAESRTSVHATRESTRDSVNQFICKALMITLAMVVLDVLGDRAPEMALAERFDPIEAFLLIDRTKRSA